MAALLSRETSATVVAGAAPRDEPAGEPIKDVVVVDGFGYGTRDLHRTRTVHKGAAVGQSVLTSSEQEAVLSRLRSPQVGRASSLALSAIAMGLTLSSGVHMPARFKPKPPRETTQADLDRLAQAEAKRARKAQKRQK